MIELPVGQQWWWMLRNCVQVDVQRGFCCKVLVRESMLLLLLPVDACHHQG